VDHEEVIGPWIEAALGRTAEEVGGYTMSSADYARRFCHPDDMHMVREETQAAIATADPYYSRQLEHRIIYANGEVGHIVVRFSLSRIPGGKRLGPTESTRI
jgi:hypothetical protein